MSNAWEAAHAFMDRNPNGNLRPTFARCLQQAWTNAKSVRRFAQEQAALTARTAESLSSEIKALENADTLGQMAMTRLSKLRAALAKARQH